MKGPHLRRDWARCCHICAGGLRVVTNALLRDHTGGGWKVLQRALPDVRSRHARAQALTQALTHDRRCPDGRKGDDVRVSETRFDCDSGGHAVSTVTSQSGSCVDASRALAYG